MSKNGLPPEGTKVQIPADEFVGGTPGEFVTCWVTGYQQIEDILLAFVYDITLARGATQVLASTLTE